MDCGRLKERSSILSRIDIALASFEHFSLITSLILSFNEGGGGGGGYKLLTFIYKVKKDAFNLNTILCETNTEN